MNQQASHYDEQYWAYQREIGKAGGVLNLFKFQEFIEPQFTVMDFGCGGGFLLKNIQCARKLGFEISDSARAHAESLGLSVASSFDEVEDRSVDCIISNHAMEHVPNPFETLGLLRSKLKVGGTIVVVVPCEQPNDPNFPYRPDDINQHLFTWCPMTLANLFKLAKLEVVASDALRHQWTPDYLTAYKAMPLADYHRKCVDHALQNNNYQVRTVGIRPTA